MPSVFSTAASRRPRLVAARTPPAYAALERLPAPVPLSTAGPHHPGR
jgi:hypothetical protein